MPISIEVLQLNSCSSTPLSLLLARISVLPKISSRLTLLYSLLPHSGSPDTSGSAPDGSGLRRWMSTLADVSLTGT